MVNVITGIIGMGMAIGFLSFMLIWVQAIPLIVIVVGVMALAVTDWVMSLRAKPNGTGP